MAVRSAHRACGLCRAPALTREAAPTRRKNTRGELTRGQKRPLDAEKRGSIELAKRRGVRRGGARRLEQDTQQTGQLANAAARRREPRATSKTPE
eukprot:3309664-Pleurochrysis_carterae.AAC.1